MGQGTELEKQLSVREEFGATQLTRSAETSMAAVTARERAIIEAEYIMAERHPRNWMDVRAAMLEHCSRPRFAEVTRYARKVGSKLVNGEWVDEIARGFTVRFAETLAQEMRNVKPYALVTYEDDLIRIVRFGVVDLERNLPRSREVAIAKTVERRGKKRKGSEEWDPPESREVVKFRLNSEGVPVFIVKATAEELRGKTNAEESRTLRDFTLRLCLRDILDDCEDRVYATTNAEDKRDPKAAIKRLLDRFQEFGVRPSDLETYLQVPSEKWRPEHIQELRELGMAIRDNHTTFDAALRAKYAAPESGEETPQQHDARLRQQMQTQSGTSEAAIAAAERKLAELQGQTPQAPPMEPVAVPDGEELPDPMEKPDSYRVAWRGNLYGPNAQRSGWIKIEAEPAVLAGSEPARPAAPPKPVRPPALGFRK